MPQREDAPNIPWLDYIHPSVVLDTFIRENTAAFAGDTGPVWKPIEPGTPYPQAVQHSQADADKYSSSIFLGQKVSQDRTKFELAFATVPQTQDIYNYAITYSGKANTLPIFKRQYLELRDTYASRNDLSPLTGLFAVQITAAGSGYVTPVVTITDSGSGSGATAIAITNATGQIVKITIKSEGQNYTPATVSVTITDSAPGTPGTGATAVAVMQPVNCLLIDEDAVPAPDPYGSLYLLVTRTYESLPGPILYDIVPDAQLGIPMMTTSQRRAATDIWTCGEIAPISFNISNATVATQTVITLSGYPTIPDIFVQEWLVISGTANTSPSLNGTWQVVGVNGNQIKLNKQLTGVTGTVGGAAQRYSYAYVERRKTDNQNVVEMITTRAITDDITKLNQSVSPVYRPYPFPDVLLSIIELLDLGKTTNDTDPLNYSYSWSGDVALPTLPGFRGSCQATRIWAYSMGPSVTIPTNVATGLPYSPTVVIPAVGTVTIETGALSKSANLGSSPQITKSTSVGFKVRTIPPVITSAYNIIQVGTGQATFNVALPSSIIQDAGSAPRAGFLQGDIITEIEPVEKLRACGIYLTTIWLIVVPYTSGFPINGFKYGVWPTASYPIGSAITTNSPVLSGGSGFAISPAFSNGLAFNTSNGSITGTPSGSASSLTYTITCTKSGLTYTSYLTIITF